MLRDWQENFVRDYFGKRQRDYLLEATPGAGKTQAAAAVAQRAIVGGLVSRVVVVVPRLPLKRQLADAFATLDVDVRPGWTSGDPWPAEAHGIVITYAALARQPHVIAAHVERGPTLVILDEVHHGNDEAAWGAAMRVAFDRATLRLSMSGTPFRSEGEPIPFVRYVDGQAQPDFSYGYTDGLRDLIVRAVNFARRGGRMEWQMDERGYRAQIEDDELSERDARRALRTAIDPAGGWVASTLRDAHEALMQMRRTDPRAAGNYQAATQSDAKAIAALLRPIVGHDTGVVLAISESDDAADRIAAFRDGDAPWLVSCDMVTEGVDVPRLRVLVYGKDELTPMVFRQAVGRVVRRPDEHDHAEVFIPDHSVLRAHAREIEQQVLAWLVEESERLEHDAESDDRARPLFTPVYSEAIDHGRIGREGEYDPQEWDRADRVKLQDPITAGLNTEHVVRLLRNSAQVPPQARPAREPRYQREAQLRSLNSQMARRVAARWDVPHDHVHAQANRAVGIASVKAATIEQLEARLAYLRRWSTTGRTDADVAS